MFDGHVLDMVEFGIEKFVSMLEFKVSVCDLIEQLYPSFLTQPTLLQFLSSLMSFNIFFKRTNHQFLFF